MAEYRDMFTDENTEYRLTITVADSPEDNADDVGTLRELSAKWGIIKVLITRKDGKVDESMLYEPITMRLTIGMARYYLRRVE